MTLEEKATSLSRDAMSREEILALLHRNAELEQRLAWLERQLFGQKSERRIDLPDARQLALGESLATGPTATPPSITIPSHERRPASKLWDESRDEGDLRFGPSVPIVEIKVPNPEAAALSPADYDIIGQKVTHRIAQRPGAYVVLRLVRDVLRLKSDDVFLCPPAPPAVFEKSVADVSFLAGLLLDKFLYHLPLYRQHQRLADCDIHLARATLTNLVHRSAALLEPIYQVQLRSILESHVLGMDETPLRAGRHPGKKGKMQSAYFWPLYGDRHEVAFPFSTSRSLAVVQDLLKSFAGVLLTDGYAAYDRYTATVQDVRRAQCWSHARRKFVDAEAVEPELVKTALDLIGELYRHEDVIRERGLVEVEKLEYRAHASKPIVDQFFAWLRVTLRDRILLPSNPFTKAADYSIEREASMRVFLKEPDVPLDTNHLEREIRPIAVGRKNWLFCWTEVGAKHVGVAQSLIRTCRLQDVDPYTYLVDVLQRVATHPAADVEQLTPRLWKEHFAANPLRSQIDLRQDSAG